MLETTQRNAWQLSISWREHASNLDWADSQGNALINRSINNIKQEIVLLISQLDLK